MCVVPRIVDAHDEDVGTILLLAADAADIEREYGGDRWYFRLRPTGLERSSSYQTKKAFLDGKAPYFVTPDCSGPRHAVMPAADPVLWRSGLDLQAGLTGSDAFYTRPDEAAVQPAYYEDSAIGATPDEVTRNCTLGCLQPQVFNRAYTPGTLLDPITPCPGDASHSCGRCCRRLGVCTGDASRVFEPEDTRLAPFHRIVPSDLGLVPPFALLR
jgi:hypothetical protein